MGGGLYEFYSMNIQASGTFWTNPVKVFSWSQNYIFLQNTGTVVRWPLTFLGWDSAWYLSIMTKGYAVSPQSYSFSPALPFAANLTNLLLQNPMASLALVSLIFGVLWVPLYQMLAENYMNKKAALLSALLLAFSPYLFVFTTVAYSEALMLVTILAAWVLLKKGKIYAASAIATIAPLTRTMGILVILPMLYTSIKSKTHRTRNVLLSLLPIASLSAWFASFGLTTGDALAPVHTTEWSYMWTVYTLFTDAIPRYGIKALLAAPYENPPMTSHWLLPFAVVTALILPLLFLPNLWKKNKELWLYALAGYVGILIFGAIASTPRFVSVLFPFWILPSTTLPKNKKYTIIAAISIIVFYIISINLWSSFLSGQFIS